MKRGWIVLAVVAVLIIMLVNMVSGTYNRLVGADQGVKQRWAQVDNQLQRRNDLIGNLVETVKGTAFQEQQVFGDIAAARAQMAGAKSPAERTAAAQTMDQALGGSALARLLVVVENYPQLKSNESFMQLMDELAGTENRLATERMRYNEEVQGFNTLIKRFPTNLYASAFHFAEAPYYQIQEAAREAPKVDMSGIRK
jgi:LemA protein